MADLSVAELQRIINQRDFSGGNNRELAQMARDYFGYGVDMPGTFGQSFDLRDGVSELEQSILDAMPKAHQLQLGVDMLNQGIALKSTEIRGGSNLRVQTNIRILEDEIGRLEAAQAAGEKIDEAALERHQQDLEANQARLEGSVGAPYSDWVRANEETLRELYQEFMPLRPPGREGEVSLTEMGDNLHRLQTAVVLERSHLRQNTMPLNPRSTPNVPAAQDMAVTYYDSLLDDDKDDLEFKDGDPLLITVAMKNNPKDASEGYSNQTVLVQSASDGNQIHGTRRFNVVQGEAAIDAYMARYREIPGNENFELQHFDGSLSVDPATPRAQAGASEEAPAAEKPAAAETAPATPPRDVNANSQIADMINGRTFDTEQSLTELRAQIHALPSDYTPTPNDREALVDMQRYVQTHGSVEEVRVSAAIGQDTGVGRLIFEGRRPLGGAGAQQAYEEIRQGIWNNITGRRSQVEPETARVREDVAETVWESREEPVVERESGNVAPVVPVEVEALPPLSETIAEQTEAETDLGRMAITKNGNDVAAYDPRVSYAQQLLASIPDSNYADMIKYDGSNGIDGLEGPLTRAAFTDFAEKNFPGQDPRTIPLETFIEKAESLTVDTELVSMIDHERFQEMMTPAVANGETARVFADVRGEAYREPEADPANDLNGRPTVETYTV